MTVKMRRLEADSKAMGGVLLEFPSKNSVMVSWNTSKPIDPTLEAAKEYAARVLQHLLDKGRNDDAERTNWPSVVAGIQHHIREFNAKLSG